MVRLTWMLADYLALAILGDERSDAKGFAAGCLSALKQFSTSGTAVPLIRPF